MGFSPSISLDHTDLIMQTCSTFAFVVVSSTDAILKRFYYSSFPKKEQISLKGK
jgi:hypothetical protein